jgi:histidinol-phosphate aminotransferase
MGQAILQSNRYPWDQTTMLRELIAKRNGLTKENVLIGAGSSEILGIVAQYAAREKGEAIAANPTFRIWWNSAEKAGLNFIKVPLTAKKEHDLPVMLSKINTATRLFYVCNPNNPTGTLIPEAELRAALEQAAAKTLVLLDEAYIDYTNQKGQADLISQYPNLVIVRTFSKIYGLAGARIGYALAQPNTIQQLKQYQPWENAGASAVSIAGAIASLDDQDFVAESARNNLAGKNMVYSTFEKLQIPYIHSHTNFIYHSVQSFAGDFPATLAANRIIGGRMVEDEGRWTRITIGTVEEMREYSNVLMQIWKT